MNELRAAVETFRRRPKVARSGGELARELIELRQCMDLLDIEFSEDAGEFAATDESDEQGSASSIDWIRHNCKMSAYAAGERVCVGEQMDKLPLSVEAVAGGEIGYAHLALIARTCRAIEDSPTGRQFDEDPLLAQAKESSVGRFRNLCYHARHAQDPLGCAADEVRGVEAREFFLSQCDDGAVLLSGVLDSAGGAVLRTALEPLASRCGADDDRRAERRLADALVELAYHTMDSGLLPQKASQRTHVQVTVPLETMLAMRNAPAADMEWSLPVSARIAERLMCDCNVTRIVLDAESAVIDVGRSRRVISGSLRRALNVRDKHCQWPGCDRPASWTEGASPQALDPPAWRT